MGISNISNGWRPGICTSTTRPTAPYEGQMIYETDTNRVLLYDNAAWVMVADTDQPPGLQHIHSGSFSGVTEYIPSSDVFSSDFDHYLVKLTIDSFSGTGQVYVQMRNSGGNAASNYRYAGYQSYSDSVIVSAVTGSGATTNGFLAHSLDYDVTEHDGYGVTMDVMNPNRAIYTTASCLSMNAINAQFYARYLYQKHSANTAYTNLRVNAVSLTSITGNIKVYGYRN